MPDKKVFPPDISPIMPDILRKMSGIHGFLPGI
jgi:hypothetical protein